MRVAEITKQNAVRKNLGSNAKEVQDLMISMSSGRRINKPSDDPVGIARVQDFKSTINRSQTLERNIGADKVWLEASEESMKQITDSLQHLKGLALEGANSTATSEFREGVASEVDTIINDLLNLGNKKEGKLFLFSGTKTFTSPLHKNKEVSEAKGFVIDNTIRSEKQVYKVDQDKPIENMLPNSFNIVLHKEGEQTEEDGGEPPIKLRIDLDGTESLNQILKKINDAADLEGGYVPDKDSRTGYRSKLYAEVGDDNYTYLEPAEGYSLSLETIKIDENQAVKAANKALEALKLKKGAPKSFLSIMRFDERELVKDEETGELVRSKLELDPAEYEPHFQGYSNQDYLVRITRGGTYGEAQFIVSDDKGKTWSKTRILQKKNEIFNPEGKASDKVDLHFGVPGKPIFRRGSEFQFEGNPFVVYKGNDQKKEVIVDNGIKVALNITAKELFYKEPDNEDTVNLFDVLNRLTLALRDDDQLAVSKSLGDIDVSINQVLQGRAKTGAIVRELEESEERIAKNKDFKMSEMSKIQDMDVAKGAVDMNNAELKNKVAMNTASRLIQPSLVDFLR